MGTVCHIGTDLCDMGWQQQLTEFYYLVTQNMDKILQTPDHEKVQIHKVERGILKIQMVIDWSDSAGLLGNKYLNISVTGQTFNHP